MKADQLPFPLKEAMLRVFFFRPKGESKLFLSLKGNLIPTSWLASIKTKMALTDVKLKGGRGKGQWSIRCHHFS